MVGKCTRYHGLLFSLVDTYSRTLINANNATGDIKMYQIVIGSLNLTVLPLVLLVEVLKN